MKSTKKQKKRLLAADRFPKLHVSFWAWPRLKHNLYFWRSAEPRNSFLIAPLDAAFRVPQTLPNTLTEIHRDNRSDGKHGKFRVIPERFRGLGNHEPCMARLHEKDRTAFSDPASEFEDCPWPAMNPGCVRLDDMQVHSRANQELRNTRIYIPPKAGRLSYRFALRFAYIHVCNFFRPRANSGNCNKVAIECRDQITPITTLFDCFGLRFWRYLVFTSLGIFIAKHFTDKPY